MEKIKHILFNTDDYKINTENTDWLLENLSNERTKIQTELMNNHSKYKHFTVKHFLSNELCDFIVNESEKFANLNKSSTCPTGWTTSRHNNYPTTDIPLNSILTLSIIIQNIIKYRLLPLISQNYNVNQYFMDCNDIFIVKYTAEAQNKLERHTDGSAFSFNILLNSSENFIGGGTLIEEQNKTELITLSKGGLLIHRGGVFHSGNEITKGTRYILVGFVNYLKYYNKPFNNEDKLLNLHNIKFNIDETNNLFEYENKFNSWMINNYESCLEKLIETINKNPLIYEKTYLFDNSKDKLQYNILEKFIYDISVFHLKKLGISLDDNYYIEFWCRTHNKNEYTLHNFHSDKDEEYFKITNQIEPPILSTVTYLNDSYYPTAITNIPNHLGNFTKVTNKNILLSFPKKLKHISFDGKYIHGVFNVFKNIEDTNNLSKNPRQTLMINYWKKKPVNVDYYHDNNNNNIKIENMNGDLNFTNNNKIVNTTTNKNTIIETIIKNFVNENISNLDIFNNILNLEKNNDYYFS